MKSTSLALGLLVSPAVAIGVLTTGTQAAHSMAMSPKATAQVAQHDWDHGWGHRGWGHRGWDHHGWRHHHHWYH